MGPRVLLSTQVDRNSACLSATNQCFRMTSGNSPTNGAQVFVNISNDGWYGDSGAYAQHLNQTRMRAIENNRWILSTTDTGVTASIDPWGRVVARIPRKERDDTGRTVCPHFRHYFLHAARRLVRVWLCDNFDSSAVVALSFPDLKTARRLKSSS